MKTSPLVNNFSAGEFGPLASARVDLDRYKASQEICENYIPRVQGGATRREGTKYVAEASTNGTTRLQSFVFSNEQAYVLEFGENYIRFFTDGAQITDGGNPVEVVTTYAEADLMELSFCQSNDVLYIFHNDYEPKKLIRYTDTSWSIGGMLTYSGPYYSYPFGNQSSNNQAAHIINSSAATGATTISFTATTGISNATAHTTGEIKITHNATTNLLLTNDQVVVAGVSGTTEANGTWTIERLDSTNVVLKGSVFVNAYSAGADTIRYAPFVSSDVGRRGAIKDPTNGWVYYTITGFTNNYTVTANIDENSFAAAPISTYPWKLGLYKTGQYPSSGCFHDDRLWLGGPFQYIAGSRVGDYENFLQTDSDDTITDSHSILVGLSSNEVSNIKWIASDEKGILIGSNSSEYLLKSASLSTPITPTSISAKKTTSFGSKSVQPVQAGKAVIFTQASGRKVREFNYFYDVDGFRCQDVTQLAHHAAESGIVQMAIQRQPEQIVWCVRDDGQLAGMTYERDLDGLKVAWHRHIIGGYTTSSGYSTIPRDPAKVLSVCCVPTADNSYDEIWLVVQRLNGTGDIVNYIEYIGQPFTSEIEQKDAKFVDSSLFYDNPLTIENIAQGTTEITITGHGLAEDDYVRIDDNNGMNELNGNVYKVSYIDVNTFEFKDFDGNIVVPIVDYVWLGGGYIRKLVSTISGLSHLNNESVQVYGDGADLGNVTVYSGSITLPIRSATVTVGLGYDSKLKLPRLDSGSQDGTSIGKTRRIHRLGFMLYRSLGLEYGTNFDSMVSMEFSSGEDQLNQAPPLFTGIKSEEFSAEYDFENKICIRQSRPYPSTILAVMPQMVTQDR